MKTDYEDNLEIIKKLEVLKSIPDRNPDKTLSGKTAFLNEASKIAAGVSPEANRRHNNWNQKNPINLFERRKERAPMLSTFASIVLAISLLLGGSGVTVAAAQASDPGDLLYNIKLLSENAVLDLTSDPESQFDIALDLVDRRSDEIVTLLSDGDLITDEIQTRYRDQIEQTILLAMNLPEDKIVQAFEKIQDRLYTQQQTLSQTKTNGSAESVAALIQTRDMLQVRLHILETSQMNLLQIMEQLRIQDQINNPEVGNSPTNFGEDAQNTPNPGNGNTDSPSMNNGDGQEGNSPWFTETPSPVETDMIDNGQNNPSGSSSPQGNQEYSSTRTVTPNPDSNGGSGSQNGNH